MSNTGTQATAIGSTWSIQLFGQFGLFDCDEVCLPTHPSKTTRGFEASSVPHQGAFCVMGPACRNRPGAFKVAENVVHFKEPRKQDLIENPGMERKDKGASTNAGFCTVGSCKEAPTTVWKVACTCNALWSQPSAFRACRTNLSTQLEQNTAQNRSSSGGGDRNAFFNTHGGQNAIDSGGKTTQGGASTEE